MIAHEEYLRATLTAQEVPLDRQMDIVAAVRDRRSWHPETIGEVRAGLLIAMDKLEGRPGGIAMLPFVGPVKSSA